MSNGDLEQLDDDATPDEREAPSRVRKARAVKKTTPKQRTVKTAAARTPARGAAARGPVAKGTPAKSSRRTSAAPMRVQVGSSEMFVTRDVAEVLTAKDLKRLRAVFKRARKRAAKKKKA
jgi:hypothetical protein